MFYRLLALLFLLIPATSYASEQETPFNRIVRMHMDNPIDFATLAAEAAQLRADYNRVVVRMLNPEHYGRDQRLSFARSFRSDFDQCSIALALNVTSQKKSISTLTTFSRLHECLWLLREFKSSFELVEAILAMDAIKAADLWSFLARSLREYASCGQNQTLVFTNKLLFECIKCVDLADNDVINNGNEKDGACTLKNMLDESNYARFILENMILHVALVKKFHPNEVSSFRLACGMLTDMQQTDRGLNGIGSSFCLYHADPILQLRANIQAAEDTPKQDEFIERKVEELKRGRIIIPNENVRLEYATLEQQGAFKDLVASYLVDDCIVWREGVKRLPEQDKIEFLRRIQQFYYSTDCVTITPLLDEAEELSRRIERERRRSAAESFAPAPIVMSKKKPVKPKEKPKKTEKERSVANPSHDGEVAVVKPMPAAVPASTPEGPRPPRVKQPTAKQKIVAKKEAKAAETGAIKAQLVRRAELKEQDNAAKLDQINITFDEACMPSLEELELYRLVWGPDSVRKAMCWSELKGRLEQFGWTVGYTGGSFTTLSPPVWFSRVQVEAPADLCIHFRSSAFLLHHPHDEAQAPMPDYVIGFLREQLGNNIGLSDIVVQAMIKKVDKKPINDGF